VEKQGIAFIDLQRLEDNPLFAFHRRIKDLAALHYASLEGRFSRTDRLRFFRVYQGGGRLRRDGKKMIRIVLKKASRISQHHQKKLRLKATRP